MRILLTAPPFAGHLHPTVALARRLRERHTVLVASTSSARAAIEHAGVEAAALLHGADAAVEAIGNPPRAVRSNPVLLNRQLRANLALMSRFKTELGGVTDRFRPDLAIAESVLPVAGIVAAERGIPWWTLFTCAPAVMENRHAPPSYLGGWSPLRSPFGAARDALGRAAIRSFKRLVFVLHGRELAALGMTGPYRQDGTECVYSPERVLFTSYRELEFADVWPAHAHFIGPLPYAGQARAAAVPEREPGRKRVFVTAGTHVPWVKTRIAGAVRTAARALPEVEFRLCAGDASAGAAQDGNVTVVPYADYGAEIARSDLVVHHAGTGVAVECLARGTPALVHPVDYDQFDTAARLCAKRLARRVRDLDRLAPAIASALRDDELTASCRRFAAAVRGYDAGAAVERMIDEEFALAAV